jgi:hypothetical protein
MKHHANKGVKRNKKPLKNITYFVEIRQILDHTQRRMDNAKDDASKKYWEDWFNDIQKFRYDDGYIMVTYKYQGSDIRFQYYGPSSDGHPLCTPDDLKTLLGDKQWSKFRQGKREFIIQRRIDGKNISTNN